MEGDVKTFRAAQYVRMSTEHQQYSTSNQGDKIKEYADKRGIEIVRTYADDGKSGLSIGGRASLQKLIADVESGAADYTLILVYDVSRWGRFQDADESAYYEYICKRRGIHVVYVAEQFENDGSPVSTIVKGVKRAMAGEYSRELSAKVFIGQCRLIELGFRQGGPAGYGHAPEALAAEIRRWKHLQAFTRLQMEEILIAKLIATAARQIAMFLVILAVVSAAIVAFIIYTMTLGKIREIAVLKLIGTRDRTIAGMILQQAMGLGVIGFIVGKISATLWAPAFPKYVLLETGDSIRGFVVVMLVCALASTLAIRAALRVDPATAIGG